MYLSSRLKRSWNESSVPFHLEFHGVCVCVCVCCSGGRERKELGEKGLERTRELRIARGSVCHSRLIEKYNGRGRPTRDFARSAKSAHPSAEKARITTSVRFSYKFEKLDPCEKERRRVLHPVSGMPTATVATSHTLQKTREIGYIYKVV